MFTRMLHSALRVCLDVSRRILARLGADSRLGEAAAILRAAHETLEARVDAAEELAEVARTSAGADLDALRLLRDCLRGFALSLLTLTRNKPRLDPCPLFFPDGYGEALRLDGTELADFTDTLITSLGSETDPRIRAHLDGITAARDTYVGAEGTARTDAKARDEARTLAEKERRIWARALVVSRMRAQELCFGDGAYVRGIFAPAAGPHRHKGEPEAPKIVAPADVPAVSSEQDAA
jgi:hypothetical protein